MIVIAVGMNGVAMAANDAGQHSHCAHAVGGIPDDIETAHPHEHAHDHKGIVSQTGTPDHDHDTCMMHACPALSADAVKLSALAGVFLTTLVWPEQPLLVRELSDGLKRPPKS